MYTIFYSIIILFTIFCPILFVNKFRNALFSSRVFFGKQLFVNENAFDWSAIRTHSKDGVVGDVFVSPVDDDVFVSPVNEDIILERNDKKKKRNICVYV